MPSMTHPARPDGIHRALVIPSLGAGGAERVLSLLADAWAERHERVTVLSWSPPQEAPAFGLHRRVQDLRLSPPQRPRSGPRRRRLRGLGSATARAASLRAALKRLRPAVVLSFVDTANVLSCLAGIDQAWPTVVAERSDPALSGLRFRWRAARRITYPEAAAVVCQTERAMRYFDRRPLQRTAVIPNPVGPPRHRLLPMSERRPVIAALGRLRPEKGFDRLIDAFAGIAYEPVMEGWSVEIAGDGPERAPLQRRIDGLGLTGRIRVLGHLPDPGPLLARSAMFCLSSRFEGFPNALLEAMAHGAAVVSVDCRSGPAEIIRSGVDGILAPDGAPRALGDALCRMAADPQRRARLAEAATGVVHRFAASAVLERWDQLLRGVVAASAAAGP
jgi:glycosyltransferase involved in cell wall biosynthesis